MLFDLTIRTSMPSNNGPHVQRIGYFCPGCGTRHEWGQIPLQTLGIVCPQCGREYELRRN